MPKDERFFELFIADGENLLAAARALEELVSSYDRIEERSMPSGRSSTRATRSATTSRTRSSGRSSLPSTEATSMSWRARLDDVVDGIQEVAETFLLYGITQPTDEAKALAASCWARRSSSWTCSRGWSR